VSTLVTVLWGLFYKEFANTSRRTKLWLALGIGLFLLAVLILAYYTNGMK
jgi:phosphoglycerol transferase MdoB-like AlkP superfamily enzyme